MEVCEQSGKRRVNSKKSARTASPKKPSRRERFFHAFKTKYHTLYALYRITGYVFIVSAIWEGSEWYLFPSSDVWSKFPSPEDWRYLFKFGVGFLMLWLDDFKLYEIHNPNSEQETSD